ncbi:methylated-DNA--[protein]-cysteine S-methyltransferase [Streptomyces sp. SID3343]|uniref:methylated-DNA--[protein]-cysteine S-methyltransferase n=1 Tax=Streptomyces sp. SID3343 TaxID=2690260 RepID=UPI00136BBF89|nr:methylated-DNA--[protein]-cysteine S-methyltransferase [Streptomyces sp. SID3343]MYV99389.1 methylated-DNA--[protein]-cysteine S-methyltransferase [Streptomyces sp. SID3343]
MTVHSTIDSPLGELLLIGHDRADGSFALASLSVPGQKGGATPPAGSHRDAAPFVDVAGQLDAYFAGDLHGFALDFATRGSAFQEQVWAALDAIPYGTTTSYGEIAARVGTSRAGVRAVGTAIGANPLLLVRPCHRVIGADGALRGYAGGLDRKEYLLTHEGALPARLG